MTTAEKNNLNRKLLVKKVSMKQSVLPQLNLNKRQQDWSIYLIFNIVI